MISKALFLCTGRGRARGRRGPQSGARDATPESLIRSRSSCCLIPLRSRRSSCGRPSSQALVPRPGVGLFSLFLLLLPCILMRASSFVASLPLSSLCFFFLFFSLYLLFFFLHFPNFHTFIFSIHRFRAANF